MAYKEEEYLLISGIQHFSFCRRQWALIHIENQWLENERTVSGEILHEKAHSEDKLEYKNNTIITRGLRVSSSELGITGSCDVVEFRKNDDGVRIQGWDGAYIPHPVEYKHGKPREDNSNELQLCAQAMCLEEMLCCNISEGALYFGEIKRRVPIFFTEELRNETISVLKEMHDIYKRGHTPKVKTSCSCKACSLNNVCLPKLMRKKNVKEYIDKYLEDQT